MKRNQIIGGKYELVAVLGKGGMGTVYRAIHTATRRPVALKVLRGEVCAENPELVARFEREARATASIQSEHIVQVFDTGHDESTGVAYLAMELLEGDVLSNLMRDLGPFDPMLAVRVAGQACLGLAKAHAAGVIHRDIKPPNLLLAITDSGERRVKILDFGIAKVLLDELGNPDPNDLTRTGNVLGSPHYMSPEQARGRRLIDTRADVWSLGIVMYKMLAGKTPHHEVSGFGDVIIAICSEPPRPIRSLAPWVSHEVAEVVHKALQIAPDDRYQTMNEMLEALRRVSDGSLSISDAALRGIPAELRASVAERALLSADVPSSPSVSKPTTPAFEDSSSVSIHFPADNTRISVPLTLEQPPRKRRGFAWLALVAVLGGGAALWFGTRGKKADPEPPKVAEQAPAPSTAPAVEPSASPPEEETRSVKLKVAPKGVEVEVDGKPATVDDGAVEVSGTIGSTHDVKLTKAGHEMTEKVAISESGAIPEELSLPTSTGVARFNARAPRVPAPSTKPTAPPKRPTTAPTTTSKPSGLKASEVFE